jgi:hypothetical protein
MKKLLYFSVSLIAISILACQDGKDEAKNNSDFSYLTTIGKQIPTKTGYRWMDVYRSKLKLVGRETPSGYSLSKENLAEMTASVGNLIGMVFQHGVDETGAHHFLIIPIDESLKIWSPGKLIIDANNDAPVSYENAVQWSADYEAANPGNILYHFFGSHVFDELNATPFFEYIQIEPAINDENLRPQVLLIVNDLNVEVSAGRTEFADALVYDASLPCPDTCPLLDN